MARKSRSAYQRAWSKRNRSKVLANSKAYYYRHRDRLKPSKRDRRLRDDYGITLEAYEVLKQAQNGVCGICGHPPGQRNLHVDHDHITGRVRGLLCLNCNSGIGKLHDNVVLLRKAIQWLGGEPNG